jgi:hypothetical protein
MSNHITINGKTYSSVDEMPPDVRRQYETAMQFLHSKNAGPLPDASAGDVNVSTTSRIVVNGKAYSRWEDVPPGARPAFQPSGVGTGIPFAPGAKQVANTFQLNSNSSTSVSLPLLGLIILLLFVLVIGVFIGIFIGHGLH